MVMNFKMPVKVYNTAMSPVATSHMLIAAGTEDVQVRLCDTASGAFTHTLSGHRDGVMTIEWSTSSDWVLMTGGCDGAIRFWDIRRAGSFQVLDKSLTQLGKRPPIPPHPSFEKASSSLASAMRPRASRNVSNQLRNSKSHSHINGTKNQRLHPGLLSTQDRATAHYGAVTGLKATEDGLYLLSADGLLL